MGCKLDFEWLSDPLLQYALYLSGFFFIGIVCCMILITHKFNSYRSHQAKQNHAIELIKTVLQLNKSDSSANNDLNAYIKAHPIDCCYGFVRVFENATDSIDRKWLKSIDIEYTVNQSLTSLFHKNQAIAIEAIGLLKLQSYRAKILARLEDPQYCPFAAEALIRLDGKVEIPKVLECHQNQLLTISQTLTALFQLDPTDLKALLGSSSSIKIPTEFLRYLKP